MIPIIILFKASTSIPFDRDKFSVQKKEDWNKTEKKVEVASLNFLQSKISINI